MSLDCQYLYPITYACMNSKIGFYPCFEWNLYGSKLNRLRHRLPDRFGWDDPGTTRKTTRHWCRCPRHGKIPGRTGSCKHFERCLSRTYPTLQAAPKTHWAMYRWTFYIILFLSHFVRIRWKTKMEKTGAPWHQLWNPTPGLSAGSIKLGARSSNFIPDVIRLSCSLRQRCLRTRRRLLTGDAFLFIGRVCTYRTPPHNYSLRSMHNFTLSYDSGLTAKSLQD